MLNTITITIILFTRSLVLCVCFVDRCLSFCVFSFGHCVVCSSIYGFWLPLWYLQTLLSCPFSFRHCIVCPSILVTLLIYFSSVFDLSWATISDDPFEVKRYTTQQRNKVVFISPPGSLYYWSYFLYGMCNRNEWFFKWIRDSSNYILNIVKKYDWYDYQISLCWKYSCHASRNVFFVSKWFKI